MSKYIDRFWVIFTIVLFTILFIIIFPILVNKYSVLRALPLSPLLIVAAVLAYIRGYWVSRWMSGGKDNCGC